MDRLKSYCQKSKQQQKKTAGRRQDCEHCILTYLGHLLLLFIVVKIVTQRFILLLPEWMFP